MVRKKRKKINKHISYPSHHYTGSKIKFVIKNILLFGLLSVLFYFFSNIDSDIIFVNFFYLLFITCGFIGFAFLIVLLILLIAKEIK